jgi:triosephosphate isomerase
MKNRPSYCIANFKMHKTAIEVLVYIDKLWHLGTGGLGNRGIILCPSMTALASLRNPITITDDNIKYEDAIHGAQMLIGKGYPQLCAQNMHYDDEGAFTGEVSAKMIRDVGANFVLLGHSERRQYFNETNEDINLKMIKAISGRNKLTPILCVGESLKERKSNSVENTLRKQLSISLKNIDNNGRIKFIEDKIVVAYEPVWAIGTGETATSEIIIEAHQLIRKILNDIGFDGQKISILYGGSVNRNNAKELKALDDVDGFLIGGASLDVDHFYNIYKY